MDGKESEPWEPLSQFSWMREYDDVIAEHRRKLAYGELEKNESGDHKVELKAPASEVLRYAKFARNHKEYWEARQRIYDWRKKNSDYKDPELAHFFGLFRGWYMRKFSIPYSSLPFMAADRLLGMNIAEKISDTLDSAGARTFLLKDSFVVDVY